MVTRRAPYILTATAAGTAALLAFHPTRPVTTATAGTAAATQSGARGGDAVAGDVEQTQYGPVQVRVTVRSGKVVAVQAVQLPQGDPRSSQISSYAAPLLQEEALSAQSASIDVVSGATYTSEGFQASLQSALSAAGVQS
jgi:uncharacterized protein with FMN-binding domain